MSDVDQRSPSMRLREAERMLSALREELVAWQEYKPACKVRDAQQLIREAIAEIVNS